MSLQATPSDKSQQFMSRAGSQQQEVLSCDSGAVGMLAHPLLLDAVSSGDVSSRSRKELKERSRQNEHEDVKEVDDEFAKIYTFCEPHESVEDDAKEAFALKINCELFASASTLSTSPDFNGSPFEDLESQAHMFSPEQRRITAAAAAANKSTAGTWLTELSSPHEGIAKGYRTNAPLSPVSVGSSHIQRTAQQQYDRSLTPLLHSLSPQAHSAAPQQMQNREGYISLSSDSLSYSPDDQYQQSFHSTGLQGYSPIYGGIGTSPQEWHQQGVGYSHAGPGDYHYPPQQPQQFNPHISPNRTVYPTIGHLGHTQHMQQAPRSPHAPPQLQYIEASHGYPNLRRNTVGAQGYLATPGPQHSFNGAPRSPVLTGTGMSPILYASLGSPLYPTSAGGYTAIGGSPKYPTTAAAVAAANSSRGVGGSRVFTAGPSSSGMEPEYIAGFPKRSNMPVSLSDSALNVSNKLTNSYAQIEQREQQCLQIASAYPSSNSPARPNAARSPAGNKGRSGQPSTHPAGGRDRFKDKNRASRDEAIDGFIYQVRFKRARRNFVLGLNAPTNIQPGMFVKVEADRGEDLGVVLAKIPVDQFEEDIPTAGFRGRGFSTGQGDRKQILRLATPQEKLQIAEKVEDEEKVLQVIREKAGQRTLPMVVLDAEYQFDRHKLTFYFEADRRIDFRELVSELFSLYKTRIWMQQVDTTTLPSENDPEVRLARAAGLVPPLPQPKLPTSSTLSSGISTVGGTTVGKDSGLRGLMSNLSLPSLGNSFSTSSTAATMDSSGFHQLLMTAVDASKSRLSSDSLPFLPRSHAGSTLTSSLQSQLLFEPYRYDVNLLPETTLAITEPTGGAGGANVAALSGQEPSLDANNGVTRAVDPQQFSAMLSSAVSPITVPPLAPALSQQLSNQGQPPQRNSSSLLDSLTWNFK